MIKIVVLISLTRTGIKKSEEGEIHKKISTELQVFVGDFLFQKFICGKQDDQYYKEGVSF